VKIGTDEFAPDFLVWKPLASEGAGVDLHQLLSVEVKYRANLAEFLRRDACGLFDDAKRAWPGLCFVLVTDEPSGRRSCFQAVALRDFVATAGVPATVDLHQLTALDIYRSTVETHEELARVLFAALGDRRLPPRRLATTARSGAGRRD
jgi:hypothetical protein